MYELDSSNSKLLDFRSFKVARVTWGDRRRPYFTLFTLFTPAYFQSHCTFLKPQAWSFLQACRITLTGRWKENFTSIVDYTKLALKFWWIAGIFIEKHIPPGFDGIFCWIFSFYWHLLMLSSIPNEIISPNNLLRNSKKTQKISRFSTPFALKDSNKSWPSFPHMEIGLQIWHHELFF